VFDNKIVVQGVKDQVFEIHKLDPEIQALYDKCSIGELFYYLEACRLQLVFLFVTTMKTFATLESFKIHFQFDFDAHEGRVGNTITYLNIVYLHNYFINVSLGPNLLENLSFENLKVQIFPIHSDLLKFNNQLKETIVAYLYKEKIVYFYEVYGETHPLFPDV